MFESGGSESAGGWSWLLFVLQQMLIPMGSLLVSYMSSSLLAVIEQPGHAFGFEDAVGYYVVIALAAFICGYLLRDRNHALTETGRMVYVLPLCVFILGLVMDSRGGLSHTLRAYFIVDSNDGDTESGIGLAVVTLPTLACCAYSFGIRRVRRESESNGEHSAS